MQGRLTGGLDQNGRCMFNPIGRMVDLVELLRQPTVELRKPCCMMGGASLSAVQIERFKKHGDLTVRNESLRRLLTVCDSFKRTRPYPFDPTGSVLGGQ